jgi:osmoprotectant transport system ATP-binding protein
MLDLKKRLGKTIVFVTHDIFEALTLGDRIAVLHRGALEQIGTKEEVLGNPVSPIVRDLFGKPARQLKAFADVL